MASSRQPLELSGSPMNDWDWRAYGTPPKPTGARKRHLLARCFGKIWPKGGNAGHRRLPNGLPGTVSGGGPNPAMKAHEIRTTGRFVVRKTLVLPKDGRSPVENNSDDPRLRRRALRRAVPPAPRKPNLPRTSSAGGAGDSLSLSGASDRARLIAPSAIAIASAPPSPPAPTSPRSRRPASPRRSPATESASSIPVLFMPQPPIRLPLPARQRAPPPGRPRRLTHVGFGSPGTP
jgi:hypothetical protein